MYFGTGLASYLRFTRSSPGQWLGSVKVLFDLPSLQFSFTPSEKSFPGLSMLYTDSGNLSQVVVDGATGVIGQNSGQPALIWVCTGRIQFKNDVFIVPAGEAFNLATDGRSILTIVQFPESAAAGYSNDQSVLESGFHRQKIRWLLEDYNLRSRYFPDHESAVFETQDMLAQLTACLSDPTHQINLPRRRIIDPKIEQAVQFIANNPDWEFNLEDLTRIVHSSERTLYYQMKRFIGMTPYRYYQRCKLLRLRIALLSCEADSPSISWHALEHGLNHLGRLPGLYASYFGEKPSETLAKRKALLVASERALSIKDGSGTSPGMADGCAAGRRTS